MSCMILLQAPGTHVQGLCLGLYDPIVLTRLVLDISRIGGSCDQIIVILMMIMMIEMNRLTACDLFGGLHALSPGMGACPYLLAGKAYPHLRM